MARRFVVIGAGAVGVGLVLRAARRPRPALRLSADGVDFHDAVTQFTLSWDEIENISGVAIGTRGFRPVVFESGGAEPSVIGSAALYVPGGVALFWMIRHYWRHPGERGDLSNGVAIERLKSRRFVAE